MQMWDWKEEAKKDWEEFGNPEWLGGDQASDWISETDAHTSLCCTEAQHWLKLQQSSHSILHPPHPSFFALPPSLTHSLYLACWLRYFYKHRLGQPWLFCARFVCKVSSYSSPWILFPWTLMLPVWVRSCGCGCQSKIMDQRGAGDSEGNWVTGRLSWLMPVWTWRDGVHHQRGCVWWAAYCPGEEL